MATLPIVRGRLWVRDGHAWIAARCPLCGREHRYDKGAAGGEEAAELQAAGFSDEWLPCQYDLPGNFWRVTFGRAPQRRRGGQRGPRPEAPPPQRDRRPPASGRERGDRRTSHGGR